MNFSEDKGVVISWGRKIKRSTVLASRLGFAEINFENNYKIRFFKIWGYVKNSFYTIKLVSKKRKGIVVLVAPPTISVYCGYICSLINKKIKIYYDFHNGVLRNEWRTLPLLKFLLRHSSVISHNPIIKKDIDSFFEVNSVLLGDFLMTSDDFNSFKAISKNNELNFFKDGKINIFVPLSYAKDEPLEYLFELIEQNQEFNFVLSGNAPQRLKYFSNLKNCNFSGFLDESEYHHAIAKSNAVLCLTTDSRIQMCAIIESISFGKITICKNFPINKALFEDYPNIRFLKPGQKCIPNSYFEDRMSQAELHLFITAYNQDKYTTLKKIGMIQ